MMSAEVSEHRGLSRAIRTLLAVGTNDSHVGETPNVQQAKLEY